MTTYPELTKLIGVESAPIEFPMGLIGLEEWQRFVLVTHPAGEPLRLLEALDDPRISLIVVNCSRIVPDYQVVLSEADALGLQYSNGPGVLLPNDEEMDTFCVLSVQADPLLVTANLLGPLVINWQSGLGRQVVLSDSDYSPNYPVASQAHAQTSLQMAAEK